MIGRALRRRLRASVRTRVTLTAAATIAVTLGVVSVGLLHALESRLVDDVRVADQSALQAQALRVLTVGPPGGVVVSSDSGDITFSVARSDGFPMVVSARESSLAVPVEAPLTGSFTQIETDGPSMAGVPFAAPLVQLPAVGSAGGVATAAAGVTGADDQRVLVTRFAVGDGLELVTASSLDDVERTLDATRTFLWFGVPALVLLVAVMAWFLVGRALRPVHAVTARVAAIGAESLHERVPVPAGSDEIGELAVTMNSMLERLETATVASRRLVSDAAHELRTPITVMRAELEVAATRPASEWPQVGTVLTDEVDRLAGLVDDLVLMARMSERGRTRDAFSLLDAVRDVGARRRRVEVSLIGVGPVGTGATDTGPAAECLADGRDPGEECALMSDVRIIGDAHAVRQAIDHLVTNAARHAHELVTVDIEVGPDAVVVHVDDDGPGIAPADRAKVLQRFVRLDEGRDRDAGGAGLGLAVAAEVAAAHDGEVTIDESALGGARVSLVLGAAGPT